MLNASSGCSFYIIYNSIHYSWPELQTRLNTISNKLTHHLLLSEPVNSDSAFAIISHHRFYIVQAILHAFLQKCCCYPVSPSLPEEYLNKLLVQSGIKNIVCDAGMLTQLKNIQTDKLFTTETRLSATDLKPSDATHALHSINFHDLVSDQNIALLMTTSGSINSPKIVPISYRNISCHVSSFTRIIPLTPQDLWLNCLPLEHIAGVMIIYRCLLMGAGMLLVNGFDEQTLWREINHYPVTHLSMVPLMLKKILDYSENTPPPATLKYVLVGGDHIPRALYERAIDSGWPLYISYGMTEASSTIAVGPSADKLQLLAGIKHRLNSTGELQIKGPMITSGYIKSNRQQSIIKNEHWFNTHDLVLCKGQVIQFSSRADNRIIMGGETIDPQLVEELLGKCAAVEDIAVGMVKHPDWGNSMVALIKGNTGKLKLWADEHLDKKLRPRFYVENNRVPRNHLGKINRSEVQRIIEKKLN